MTVSSLLATILNLWWHYWSQVIKLKNTFLSYQFRKKIDLPHWEKIELSFSHHCKKLYTNYCQVKRALKKIFHRDVPGSYLKCYYFYLFLILILNSWLYMSFLKKRNPECIIIQQHKTKSTSLVANYLSSLLREFKFCSGTHFLLYNPEFQGRWSLPISWGCIPSASHYLRHTPMMQFWLADRKKF